MEVHRYQYKRGFGEIAQMKFHDCLRERICKSVMQA